MNGNCHFIFGACVGVTTVLLTNQGVDLGSATIMGSLLGSVFPDIDNPKSHFGALTVPVSTVIGKIGSAFGKKGSHHRGIFHDPFFYIVGLVLTLKFAPYLSGLFVGALSHIFLDMFNPSGIRVLGVKFIRLAKLPSGSYGANILSYVLSFVILAFGIFSKYYGLVEKISYIIQN